MKTLLTILVAAATISAQALSFDWGTGSVRVQFGTGNYITDGSVTATLLYLGTGVTSLTIDGVDNSYFEAGSKASSSTGLANKKGLVSATYSATYGETIGSASTVSGKFDNGASFALLLSYVSEGKTYYNYSANIYTVSGIDPDVGDASTLGDATFTFDMNTKTTLSGGQSATAGGGWTVVPEPSTAALALAGLALLLKRRKA